jgi:aquaporin Z
MQSVLDKEHVLTFTLHSRALVMEMLGTFLLCYFSIMVPSNIGADTSISSSIYGVGLVAFSLAYGYAHLIGKHISGGHYNPAVTIAMAFTGKMPYLAAFIYIFFQFLGAALGSYLTGYIFNIDMKTTLLKGQNVYLLKGPQFDITFYSSLTAETIGTLMLIIVFLRTWDIKQEDSAFCAAAIALTQLFISTGAWLLTGWGNNPARIFGITFFANTVANTNFWIYYLGPLLAAILAWYFERYLLADSHGEFASDLRKLGRWFNLSDTPMIDAHTGEAPAPPVVISTQEESLENKPIRPDGISEASLAS